jgi:hypothetical protein
MLCLKGFMNKLRKLFRSSLLWILLAPYGIFGLGAASNQAVLIANHDKFPVMLNARKLDKILNPKIDADLEKILGIKIVEKPAPKPDPDGMLDDVHCVMTKDTHLNALADVFDLGGIYSIGDFILYIGEWMQTWVPFVWASLIIGKAYRQEL